MDRRHMDADRRVTPLRIIGGLLALAFVFGPACAGLLGVRERPIENRALAPAPRLGEGWDALGQVTPWAVDRLPGRSKAVEIKANMDYYGYGDLPGTQVAQPVGAAGAPAARKSGAADGVLTPTVVRGKDGYLFYGVDFVSACNSSARFQASVDKLNELGRLIEGSGRKVLITVAPNKSSVVSDALPGAMPRGACAKNGIAAENRVLDTYRDPLWVGLRSSLAALDRKDKDAYWRTDTHWTTLGGSIWARRIADRLRPSLAKKIRFTPTDETKVADLMALIGLKHTESPDSVSASTGATVTNVKAEGYDAAKGIRQTATWVSRPGTDLIRGHSLIVGDSFTYFILPILKPLFAHGTFDWLGSTPSADIIEHIGHSDTVVLEVAQRNLISSPLVTPKFYDAVAEELGMRH